MRTFNNSRVAGFSVVDLAADDFNKHFRNRDFYHIYECAAAQCATDAENTLAIWYYLVFEGIFDNPFVDHPDLSIRGREANVRVTIAKEVCRLQDLEFRSEFAEQLRSKTSDLSRFLISEKKVKFLGSTPQDCLEAVLKCYLSLSSPLSPAPFEHESNPYAPSYTGYMPQSDNVTYFLHFSTLQQAQSAIKEVQRLGYEGKVTKADAVFVLAAEVIGARAADGKVLEDVAISNGGEYDGWEASR